MVLALTRFKSFQGSVLLEGVAAAAMELNGT